MEEGNEGRTVSANATPSSSAKSSWPMSSSSSSSSLSLSSCKGVVCRRCVFFLRVVANGYGMLHKQGKGERKGEGSAAERAI